jgi:hypothetical protein
LRVAPPDRWLEIINSLRLIRRKGSDDTALRTLFVHHPARAVRTVAPEILRDVLSRKDKTT